MDNEMGFLDESMDGGVIDKNIRSNKNKRDESFNVQEVNEFEDIGLPAHHGADGYFETNPNDLSQYAYDTGREMIADEGDFNVMELSEQKDLLPRAMRPDEFENLDKVYHLDQSVENGDQAAKDANQDVVRFERMKEEYEKLYTEFVRKSIQTMREK